jgi:SAM-dependent methyltransferase
MLRRDWDDTTYGEAVADRYDELHADMPVEGVIRTLAELAGPGPVLELGVGTGRLALPLGTRGVEVHGVESSPAMIDALRAKDAGSVVRVIRGSFHDAPLPGPYTLAFVAFNTFFALTTQADQVRCFEHVAAHLVPGGRFVLECFIPDPTRFPGGQAVRAVDVGTDGAVIEVTRHDHLAQIVESQLITLGAPEHEKGMPIRARYAWPSELDLMARLAGLELADRWGDWDRSPLTPRSISHVSVYVKPA